MYRLVFISLCPVTRHRKIEYGPWQSKRETVEHWADYFRGQLVRQSISIEDIKDGSISNQSMDMN